MSSHQVQCVPHRATVSLLNPGMELVQCPVTRSSVFPTELLSAYSTQVWSWSSVQSTRSSVFPHRATVSLLNPVWSWSSVQSTRSSVFPIELLSACSTQYGVGPVSSQPGPVCSPIELLSACSTQYGVGPLSSQPGPVCSQRAIVSLLNPVWNWSSVQSIRSSVFPKKLLSACSTQHGVGPVSSQPGPVCSP